MKKRAVKFAALCLAAAVLVISGISVSAEKYTATVISDSFSSASACEFLQPGDIDKNGSVDTTDLVFTRKSLLGVATDIAAAYFDVNGDDDSDIRDLVHQKKIIVAQSDFITSGAMQLNGNSIYSGDFVSVMGTGAEYKISLSYTSDTDIRVKINGFGEEKVFTADAASEQTTVTFNYKTPLSKSNEAGVELQIIGVGAVSDFSVTRLNMDNEFDEVW